MMVQHATSPYVIADPDDDRWYYLLPIDLWGTDAYADDQPMTQLDNRRWWVSTHRARTTVAVVKQGERRVLAYELIDPAAESARFPARLDFDAWRQLSEHEQEIRDPLYRAVSERLPGKRTEFPAVDIIDLGPAELPPQGGPTWVAELPYELAHHPEVRHLFPGHLQGFPQALRARLDEIPNLSAYLNGGTFSLYAKVPYSPKRTKWQGDLLRSGKRSRTHGREVEETTTRHIDIHPQQWVAGVNHAAARREWDRLLDAWVAEVKAWMSDVECGHCKGTGLAPTVKPGAPAAGDGA